MKEALKEAQKAFDADEVPIGAVIVCQNKIIARAHNYTEHLNDVTAHAEMQAFTSAANNYRREISSGMHPDVTIEPCVMCAGASYWTQIGENSLWLRRTRKKDFQNFASNILHPSTEIKGGVLETDCADITERILRKKRKPAF